MKKTLNIFAVFLFLAGVTTIMPNSAFSHPRTSKSSVKKPSVNKTPVNPALDRRALNPAKRITINATTTPRQDRGAFKGGVKKSLAQSVQAKKKKPSKAKTPASQDELKRLLIQKFSKSFPAEYIEDVFSRLTIDRSIFASEPITCKLPDGSERPYRGYFDPVCGILTEKSLRRGKEYLAAHREDFDRTNEECGVEPEVIAAIFRVETNFGNFLGKWPVLNALYTHYLLEPNRRNEALINLEYALRIAYDQKKHNPQRDPLLLIGSSWGAFGIPQFMPASYWYLAVDGDGDKIVDLFNHADAIASTCNYLRKNGWADDEKSKRKTLWVYNRDEAQVKAVLSYAGALKKFEDTELPPAVPEESKPRP